jgi:putative nucleotidyltransferase with HDIG domain
MRRILPAQAPSSLATSDVLAALSFSLDMTEGQPAGHALRACCIGLEIARRAGASASEVETLYHASLLKDAGCASNAARVFQLFGGDDLAAKRDLKRVDWARYFDAMRYALAHAAPGAPWHERLLRVAALAKAGPAAADDLVRIRCARGAQISRELGFGDSVAAAVAALDEHWDGHGRPERLRGAAIPPAARIMLIAQTLDVFAVHHGAADAVSVVLRRAGRWFDPDLARACRGLEPLLQKLVANDTAQLQREVHALDPSPARRLEGAGALARVAEAFAAIVDSKSPFTATHSRRVTAITMDIARRMHAEGEMLRIAALLHDLGKLAVPNAILDKPGPLTDAEWSIVRRHPQDSERILRCLGPHGSFAFIAGAHHERLDGRGYHRGLTDIELPLEARILAVADVFESLTAHRPYRAALSTEAALELLERDRGVALDADVLDALVAATGHMPADGDSETLRAA